MQQLSVVILAAGRGKRMISDLPKVLHQVGGKSLLGHVLATAGELDAATRLVVYGHGGEAVKASFADQQEVLWVEQAEQLGTGHAVAQALPSLDDGSITLVLYGDVPLVQAKSLRSLVMAADQGRLALLTVELVNPANYGRIVRNEQGRVQRIVEEKDATPSERKLTEINTGILAVSTAKLRKWVTGLENDNAQGEYYLTDVIAMAVQEGITVEAFIATEPKDVQGVNDRRQLVELERHYQRRQAGYLLDNGAMLRDSERVDVRGTVVTGKDVEIDINVIFEGEVHLGDRVKVGAGCVLRDAVIGDDVTIQPHCCIEGASVGAGAQIGPFARLRQGTDLAGGVRIGNFVETKKATISMGSKVNHLTYIGDAEIGAGVNVGAGTITCNYDGVNKYKTVIKDGAFIGSNSSLVAPVQIGQDATIGAGSAVSGNVPDRSLCLTRSPRKEVANWQRPVKVKT